MPRIQFNMRIDQDIKSMLDDVAQSQNRTTANLIEWIFKQYVDQVAKRTTTEQEKNADAWDKQIAADAAAGKLDFLLSEAQNDYDAGKRK